MQGVKLAFAFSKGFSGTGRTIGGGAPMSVTLRIQPRRFQAFKNPGKYF